MGGNEYDDDHVLNICKVAALMILLGRSKGYDLEIKEEVLSKQSILQEVSYTIRKYYKDEPLLNGSRN